MRVTTEDSWRRKLFKIWERVFHVKASIGKRYQFMRWSGESRTFCGVIDVAFCNRKGQGFQPSSAGFRHASYYYIGVFSNEVALKGIHSS
jgi:hypothetical protein